MSKSEKKIYPKFLLKIENIRHERLFNTVQFGPYENAKTGKTINLINPDGRAVESGVIVSRITSYFDVEFVKNAEIVRFLMGHPENIENGGQGFSLTDVNKLSDSIDDDLIKELELESRILTLDSRKLKGVASALGLSYKGAKKAVQASVIRRVRQEQIVNEKKVPGYISVAKIVDAKKTMVLLDITQMEENKLITINNSGIYVHGNHSMGLSKDRVALYLQENQELYSQLKRELRLKLQEKGELELDPKDKGIVNIE